MYVLKHDDYLGKYININWSRRVFLFLLDLQYYMV